MASSSEDELFLQESLYKRLEKNKKRKYCVNNANLSRVTDGEYHNLYEELRQDEQKFVEYARMSIATFDYILERIDPLLRKYWPNFIKTPIVPSEKLFLTLRYLSTGISFRSLSLSFRMGFSTIRQIVLETCEALWTLLQPIHMPEPTEVGLKIVAADFWTLRGFPNCVGAIGGKHIRVKNNSIVLQAVADAKCKFIAINICDADTFISSTLSQIRNSEKNQFPMNDVLPNTSTSVPHVFVADEAYPLLEWVLRPYHKREITPENEYFNECLANVRICVECAFGIMNEKWRILLKPIQTQPTAAETIIKAICVLYNTIIDKEGLQQDLEERENFIKHSQLSGNMNPSSKKNGRLIRDTFSTFLYRNSKAHKNNFENNLTI